MYTLLSKSIYFHPPGTKPSLKPPELIQNPEKPFNFTHSLLIHCTSLLFASLSFFDNRSDWFQLGSVSKGKQCISHFSSSPSLTSGFPPLLSLFFPPSFSATLSSVPLLFRPAKPVPWRKLLQSAQIPPEIVREKWVRMRKMKQEREKEGPRKEGEDRGMATMHTKCQPCSQHTHIHF